MSRRWKGKIHAGGGYVGSWGSRCGVYAKVVEIVEIPEGENPLVHITCQTCKKIVGRSIAKGFTKIKDVNLVRLGYTDRWDY